jgi:hypothetical protein
MMQIASLSIALIILNKTNKQKGASVFCDYLIEVFLLESVTRGAHFARLLATLGHEEQLVDNDVVRVDAIFG